jgi:DNA-binding transcriptional LysR family regulator
MDISLFDSTLAITGGICIMNMTQIRNVVAVAQARNVSRAAELLHVAQPSITKSIKALEAELGVALFKRSRTGMSLTIYGESWLRHARVVQSELSRGVAELEEMKKGVAQQILVAGAPLVTPKLLPDAISRTLAESPNTHFSLIDGTLLTGNRLRNAFEEGSVDLVLSIFDPGDESENLAYEFLFDVDIRFIVRKDHPVLQHKSINWGHLADYPWIGPPLGSRVRALLDYEFRKVGITPPHIQIETSDRAARGYLLESRDMIGFSSYHPSCENLDLDRFKILPMNTVITPWSIGIIRRMSSEIPPITEQFIGHIRDIVNSSTAGA